MKYLQGIYEPTTNDCPATEITTNGTTIALLFAGKCANKETILLGTLLELGPSVAVGIAASVMVVRGGG